MKIADFKEFLPYTFKIKAAVMVHGKHGIGKSQVIRDFAKENGLNFIDRRLSQMESGDLLGLPDLSDGTTKFITPSWLPRDPKSKGILFLDEINRARPDVLQGVFQLVLDRQLGDYSLPEGWHVVSAVNPNTDDYHVTNVFDQALLDRFCHVKLTPSVDEFIAYAQKQTDLDQNFVSFLQAREELIENSKLADFSIGRMPSRRSNIAASRLVAAGLPDNLMIEGLSGFIGMESAAAFVAWIKENQIKPFSAEEVMKKYDKIEEKLIAYTDTTSGRHDILTATCDNLFNYIETNAKKIKQKETDNFLKFLEKLPKDLSFSMVKRLLASKDEAAKEYTLNSVLDTPVTDWIMNVAEEVKAQETKEEETK